MFEDILHSSVMMSWDYIISLCILDIVPCKGNNGDSFVSLHGELLLQSTTADNSSLAVGFAY